MEAANSPNSFIFNQKIDASYLLSLYEGDHVYIEQIFKTALDHYDSDLAAIQVNYNETNLVGLRKAVHKIKPAFGFIGMPDVQELCFQFEQSCSAASGTEELSDKLKTLMNILDECKTIIKQDYEKLVSYNKP